MRRRADPLFVLFFVSGFSGLIYESVWTHYVKLFLGHAAYAQTLVLVVFIGGLALGSWLCARWARSIANPLRAYALIEGAIGAMALVFHTVFVATVEWGYASLLPATCEPASPICATQWALSALLLAPQSVLLGATFPLMSSAVIRLRESGAGHDIATLYFLNSLGAVMGVLASAFVLIPSTGLPGTLLTAGLANCAIALIAFLLSRGAEPPLAETPAAAGEGGPWYSSRLTPILLWTALLTGLSSFVYEIAWIRMLSLVLGASTHAFELMLASFILGLALGGLWVRHRVDHTRDPVRFLAIVQLVMGLAAAATLPIYTGTFDFIAWLLGALNRTSSGFLFFNLGSTVAALLVMLPATFCAGMTLPLITFRLLRSPTGEKALGMVYAVNTLGSILGVILAVHLLLEWLGLKGAIIVGAAIDVAVGAALLVASAPEAGRRVAAHWPAVAAVAGLVFIAVSFETDPRRTASGVFRSGHAKISPDQKVIYHRDGKTATVDVLENAGVRSIRTNGKSDAAIGRDRATSDEYTMALLALLPMGHQPNARRAAVIGFGSGMSTAVLLTSPRLERVDTIEIEPAMVEGANLFRPAVEGAYADPRSRIVIDDAKSYFARGRERYDIIVSEPSNPWVSGVASLFTEEFYGRLHAYLNDGGVLAQWLHTYEMDTATLASILKAVARTFPDFMVYSSIDTDLVLIARKGGPPGTFQAEALASERLKPILAKLKLGDPQVVRRRAVASWSTLAPYFGSFDVAANSDYFPIVDHRASRSRFTRDRVVDLLDLQGAPLPMLEMLDHGVQPPERRQDSAQVALAEIYASRAWKIHDLIVRDGPMTSGTVHDPDEVAAQLVRQWMTQCRSEITFGQAFPHLLRVAETVNPNLHAAVATRLWAAIGGSPCARGLAAGERDWIDLFAAVAGRDAPRMSSIGMRLLESERKVRSAAAEYAFLSTVTASICQRETARAQELLAGGLQSWLRPGEHRSELRYLYNLANAKDTSRASPGCPTTSVARKP